MSKRFKHTWIWIGLPFVILIIFLPVFVHKYKEWILDVLGSKELTGYYDVVSAIASGFAVIVALISIDEQRKDSLLQNKRDNYSVQAEAITQVISVKKFLLENNPDARTIEEMNELARLSERLHNISDEMAKEADTEQHKIQR